MGLFNRSKKEPGKHSTEAPAPPPYTGPGHFEHTPPPPPVFEPPPVAAPPFAPFPADVSADVSVVEVPVPVEVPVGEPFPTDPPTALADAEAPEPVPVEPEFTVKPVPVEPDFAVAPPEPFPTQPPWPTNVEVTDKPADLPDAQPVTAEPDDSEWAHFEYVGEPDNPEPEPEAAAETPPSVEEPEPVAFVPQPPFSDDSVGEHDFEPRLTALGTCSSCERTAFVCDKCGECSRCCVPAVRIIDWPATRPVAEPVAEPVEAP